MAEAKLYFVDSNVEFEEPDPANPEEMIRTGAICDFHIGAESPDQAICAAMKTLKRKYPTLIGRDTQIWIDQIESAMSRDRRKFKISLEELTPGTCHHLRAEEMLLFYAKNNVTTRQTGEVKLACEGSDFHFASQYPDLAANDAYRILRKTFPTMIRKELVSCIDQVDYVEGLNDKRYFARLERI